MKGSCAGPDRLPSLLVLLVLLVMMLARLLLSPLLALLAGLQVPGCCTAKLPAHHEGCHPASAHTVQSHRSGRPVAVGPRLNLTARMRRLGSWPMAASIMAAVYLLDPLQ